MASYGCGLCGDVVATVVGDPMCAYHQNLYEKQERSGDHRGWPYKGLFGQEAYHVWKKDMAEKPNIKVRGFVYTDGEETEN